MRTTVFSPFWCRLLCRTLLMAVASLAGCMPVLPQQPADQPERPVNQPQPQQPVDPPGRVFYVSAIKGRNVALLLPGTQSQLILSPLNWPVPPTNPYVTNVMTHDGERAELDGGWIVMRLQNRTELTVLQDDATTNVSMGVGSVSVRVRRLQVGERMTIGASNGVFSMDIQQPGEYRVDYTLNYQSRMDSPTYGEFVTVTVRAGAATVESNVQNYSPVTVSGGQQVTFKRVPGSTGYVAIMLNNGPAPTRDAFDQWAAQRDALADQSPSAQYISRGTPGYQALDGHGQWKQDPTYGPVWYPAVPSNWVPYRDGNWAWIDPWGWTWIDAAPWGFAPSHYGRWAQIGQRWAWVPGPIEAQPTYAPALVGFIGGGTQPGQPSVSIGDGVSIGDDVSIGGGISAIFGWFPLAPGEYWQPDYGASDGYLSRVNRSSGRRSPHGYRYQHRSPAISVAAPGSFSGRNPHGPASRFKDGSHLPPGALNNAELAPPPPNPDMPRSPAALRGQARGATADGSRSPVPTGSVIINGTTYPNGITIGPTAPRRQIPGATAGGNPTAPVDTGSPQEGASYSPPQPRVQNNNTPPPQRWAPPPGGNHSGGSGGTHSGGGGSHSGGGGGGGHGKK